MNEVKGHASQHLKPPVYTVTDREETEYDYHINAKTKTDNTVGAHCMRPEALMD